MKLHHSNVTELLSELSVTDLWGIILKKCQICCSDFTAKFISKPGHKSMIQFLRKHLYVTMKLIIYERTLHKVTLQIKAQPMYLQYLHELSVVPRSIKREKILIIFKSSVSWQQKNYEQNAHTQIKLTIFKSCMRGHSLSRYVAYSIKIWAPEKSMAKEISTSEKSGTNLLLKNMTRCLWLSNVSVKMQYSNYFFC